MRIQRKLNHSHEALTQQSSQCQHRLNYRTQDLMGLKPEAVVLEYICRGDCKHGEYTGDASRRTETDCAVSLANNCRSKQTSYFTYDDTARRSIAIKYGHSFYRRLGGTAFDIFPIPFGVM